MQPLLGRAYHHDWSCEVTAEILSNPEASMVLELKKEKKGAIRAMQIL